MCESYHQNVGEEKFPYIKEQKQAKKEKKSQETRENPAERKKA